MANRALTRAFYDALLAAFREAPGNYARAARGVGCDPQTAKKAWNQGWLNRYEWAKPMRGVLAEEAEHARAALAREEEERRRQAEELHDRARQDAVAARVEEAKVIRVARANTLAVLAATNRIAQGAQMLSQRLMKTLSEDEKALTTVQAARFFHDLANITRQGNESAKLAMQLERLHLGEPTEILGIVPADMTLEEAQREIELAQEELAEARRRGLVPPPMGQAH